MLTSSHGYWGLRLTRGRDRGPWLVLGAVGPDLPAFGAGLTFRASGVASGELIDRVYHRGTSRRLQLAAHSALACAGLGLTAASDARRRAVAAGWLSHLVIDALTHHDDAWPFLWPLTDRRWRSPVSYWQAEHHSRGWTLAECVALTVATASDPRRVGRTAGAIALCCAATPLLKVCSPSA